MAKLAFYGLLALVLNTVCNASCLSIDVEFWRNGGGFFTSVSSLQKCGTQTAADPDQIAVCVDAEFEEYSDACQLCFEDIILCTAQSCLTECLLSVSGIRQQPCIECVETNCNPAFFTCAGFRIDVCEGCVDPNAPNDVVPIVMGSLGGVLAVALGAACIVYRIKHPKPKVDLLVKLGIPLDEEAPDSLPTSHSRPFTQGVSQVRNPIESTDFDGAESELGRIRSLEFSDIVPMDNQSTVTKDPEF